MRISISLFSTFAALLLATSADAQDIEPNLELGERLVDARCTFCHGKEALSEFVERCSSEHGEDYLEEFLRSHHAPDDESRADIIAFLTCRIAE